MTPLKFLRESATTGRMDRNRNYIGWLATLADEPETIVGGAGVQVNRLPRPLDSSTIGEGRQGTIVNVFTEPDGDGVESRACSLKRLSSGPGASGSTGCYFTLRTKAARFTNG